MKPTIECAECGNVVKQKRPWQRFCSKKCRGDHHATEVKIAREHLRKHRGRS